MAEVVKLVQGSQSLDLTAGNYVAQEVILNPSSPDELWHQPDQGERRMVRSEAADRSCTVKIRVPITVTDEDTLQNAIVAIRRYLAEAIRYELNGDNSPVYLQLQKNNATNAVNHRIKSGVLDDSQSHYRPERTVKTQALDLFLNLTLAPYGEWTSTITLDNMMTSSPHFVEDSDADGLADGWNELNTPTTTIDTTAYLIGGASQKVVTDNSTAEGVFNDWVTVASSTDVVGYVWIYTETGGDDVRVQLDDDVANIGGVKTFGVGDAGSISDKSVVDSAGNTWYRVVLSGTTDGSATQFRLVIQRHNGIASANTTFYIDACYMTDGTTTAPDAWMSARAIDNRNDIQSTSAATENYLNYIDVWGIPGDAPALATWKFDIDTSSTEFYMGRGVDGKSLIANQRHWVEDEFTADYDLFSSQAETGNGTWSRETDGTPSDGSYVRYTDHATPTGGTLSLRGSGTTTNDLKRMFDTPRRVYMAIRSNAATPTDVNVSLDISIDGGTAGEVTIMSGETISPAVADTWYLLDCGLFNAIGLLPDTGPNTSSIPTAAQFKITISGLGSSERADFDFIFMPFAGSSGEFAVIKPRNPISGNHELWMEGVNEKAISQTSGYYSPNVLGGMWRLEPGSISNRLTIMAVSTTSNTLDLTKQYTVQLDVIPRTTHLLGT